MNEKFIQLYETSGLSLYELAKKTGLSYTTVNELKREVLDINKCSVKHVCKLAELFCVPIEELMNPCFYMEGISGRYRKIRYVWKKGKTMILTFTYKNLPVELDSGLKMTVAGRREAYILIGDLMIDRFLQKKDFAEKADRWIEEYGDGRTVSADA